MNTPINHLTAGFIGLGLIGGSIARGLKRSAPDIQIMAYMRTREKLEQAHADGIVDLILDGVDEHLSECDIIFLDFHAETTSEKIAMGWYLDGRVNGVVGTHTHVQTADERILPQGTAYITDLGMVGPRDSVLGVKTDLILKKFTTAMPVRFDVAEGPCVYSALIVEIDTATNKTCGIERIMLQEDAL